MTILVAGGTGTVGKEVVKGLVAKGLVPRVLSRSPNRELFGPSVEVVRGDFTEPASLIAALRGVDVAYLATSPTPELGAQEGNFIEAARASKLRRLIKVSGYGIEHATDRIHRAHALSEALIRSSGIEHVILQPVMFMSNLLWEAAAIKQGTIASTFGDGRMSFIDARDVAEVAVVALTTPERIGGVWAFGGPEPLSYDDVAATFSRVLGRRVEHVRLDDDRFRQAASQLPDFVVEAITASGVMAREGKYEVADTVIREKLGRRARSLESWIKDHEATFTA